MREVMRKIVIGIVVFILICLVFKLKPVQDHINKFIESKQANLIQAPVYR